MTQRIIRRARAGDQPGAYYVCLKTGHYGDDGEARYREDPDALGRIFVGPYLAFEPELSLVLEDAQGICGYVLGAQDSRAFYRATKPSGGPGCARSLRRPPAIRRSGRTSSRSTTRITIPTTSVPIRTTRIRRTCTSTCCRARSGTDTGGR